MNWQNINVDFAIVTVLAFSVVIYGLWTTILPSVARASGKGAKPAPLQEATPCIGGGDPHRLSGGIEIQSSAAAAISGTKRVSDRPGRMQQILLLLRRALYKGCRIFAARRRRGVRRASSCEFRSPGSDAAWTERQCLSWRRRWSCSAYPAIGGNRWAGSDSIHNVASP